MSNNTVSKFLLGTCLAIFVSTGFSNPNLSVNAQANNLKSNQRNRTETSNILKNIKNKDPLKAQSQKLTKAQGTSKDGEMVSKQENLEVKFSLGEKKVRVSGKTGNLNINIPNKESFDAVDTVEDKVIYSGKNAKTDLILESVEGGIRQIINIKDSTAPNTYDFKMDLEKDDEILINKDGSAVVLTKDSDSVLKNMKIPENAANKELLEMLKKGKKVKFSIGKPWAKDANGKELETKYTVENKNTLRQHINLKDAAFPVVADPIWCGNAISSVSWISRNGVWSASVRPTFCGSWNCGGQWNCWQEAYNKTPYHSAWPYPQAYGTNTYWSMYNQFACHADFAKGFKFDWNLEPGKRDKGYWGFANFRDLCN